MFRRVLVVLFSVLILGGCTGVGDLAVVLNPIAGLQSGLWQTVFIAEATTNFSSLLYDKTEAKVDTFTVHPIQLLPDNCTYYIMPVIYSDIHDKRTYDDSYSRVIANYMRLNSFGIPVDTVADADYVMVVTVNESPELYYGSNTSSVALSIMEQDETPVFYAKTSLKSSSDSNFYYRASKGAKPVHYLTLKGFEKIFDEALPQAFS